MPPVLDPSDIYSADRAGPHGLCVYPQPGRYSLGHTGVFR
jgi:hypothetical protein